MRNFRQYEVWAKAVDIADIVYALCDGFPKYELFALGDQLRRAAVSIASNIAEGASRTSTAEFAHYLEVAIGSAFEVETQLLIARRRDYLTEEVYNTTVMELQSLERQLNTFISRIRNEQPTTKSPKPTANSQ
jgi:four helix bundle protein